MSTSQMHYHYHQPVRQQQQDTRYPHHSQLRLKCIVLGSAGAGKTCLLRRFIHGTFEGQGNDESLRSNSICHNNRRRGRSTTSTLGADYYVKKVDNPLFGSDGDCNRDSYEEEKKITSESHVLVQLWDTAGKERLKPQTYPAQYDKKSNFYQFLSIRPSSSTNSTNYEHRYNNWGFLNGITEHEHHDENDNTIIHNEQKDKLYKRHNTQQKHGRPLHYHRHNGKYLQNHSDNKPMGDALFRNIDACMLVYDATSSMSFLHLMQWHSEWVQKLNHWEREGMETIRNNDTGMGERKKTTRKRIPFIVVANKLDLLEEGNENKSQSSGDQKRRSVMGFREGAYKGRELRYEYAAENAKISQCECSDLQNQSKPKKCELHRNNASAARTERLTYSLKETLWSTDASYINALQLTEDQLHTGRELILLWCKRNGIPHVEASALDGRGVDEAMEHLIRIGVEELEEREKEKVETVHDREGPNAAISPDERSKGAGITHVEFGDPKSTGLDTSTQIGNMNPCSTEGGTNSNATNAVVHANTSAAVSMDPSQYYFLYQPRQEEELDLFARYSPKDEQRCSLFKCWMSLFSYCER
ncbi:hypothetical protein ACHAXR_011749 [Thalassiosira sp. AJA248-18]